MVLLQNRCAEAVRPAYDALAAKLPAEPVLNIDESPTKEASAKAWVRDGTLPRAQFLIDVQPIRREIDSLLLRGYFNPLTASVCKELWVRRAHLWTFLEVEGVEPTNNAAERALRHAVIWRKLSFGTPSAGGSRFVERMLTVIETSRRQGTNAFEWLTEAVQANLNGQAGPRLAGA